MGGGSCVYFYCAFYQVSSFYQVKCLSLPWSKDRLGGILLDLRIPGDTFTYYLPDTFSLHQECNLFCSYLSFSLVLVPIYLGSGLFYTAFGSLFHLWKVYPLLKDFLLFSSPPSFLFLSHTHIPL